MKRKSIRLFLSLCLLSLAPVAAQISGTPVLNCSLPENASNAACRGMEEILPGYAGANCTANDVSVVLVGLGVQQDGCINTTDSAEVLLEATLTCNANTRYDIAWFIPLTTTGTGRTGLHQPGYLTPVTSTIGGIHNPNLGPFRNSDGDTCGEILSADVQTRYAYGFPVRLPCERVSAGFLNIPRCVVWAQSDDRSCGNIFQTGTTNAYNSKCNCTGSSATDIPGPDVRKTCTNFENPTGLGTNGQLDQGETATFTIPYSNTVPGCTPGTPTASDPAGRLRCGTASFLRIVIEYGTAGANGTFYVPSGDIFTGSVNAPAAIPACSPPTFNTVQVDTNTASGVTNYGVVCNDTDNNRLIFAPRDPNSNNAYTVLSAFSGTQTLPILYTKTNTSTDPISMTSRLWWDNVVDTTAPLNAIGSISAAEAVDLTGAIQQTCSNCTCSTTVQATPITLASFEAQPAGRGARFEWSTETEVGNVGFNLYALVGGKRVKLNDEPIPTASIDSLEPQSYEAYFDVPYDAEGFVIEDLDLVGKARAHGPFEAGKRYGEKIRNERIDWGAIRREHGMAAKGDARQIGRGRASETFRGTAQARAPKGGGGGGTTTLPTIELHVSTDGIYRVTYEQLLAAGFDLSAQAGSGFALRAAGKAVPLYVSTTGKFGPGNYLEFWGEALDTLYTATNVYRLDVGQRKPARVGIDATAPAGAAEPVYVDDRRYERNLGFAFWSPASDPFFDLEMMVFSTAKSFNRTFSISGYVPGVGPSTIRAEIFGGSSFQHVPLDHHVEFRVNGTFVGEAKFDGMTGYVFEGEIPDGILVEGTNTLTMRLPSVPGAQYDLVSLDWLEIRHPRQFAAKSGRLDFVAAGGRFDVAGLTSDTAVAYRRSGDTVTRLNGVTVAPGGTGFVASLPGSASSARYRVAGLDTLLSPAAIQAARPVVDIKTGPASYLVISHAAFSGSLQPLLDARAAQGHTVKVVDVEEIYAQFNHGIFDAAAIRAYIAHAYAAMGTRYVLLVGGDTYDYRNYLGLAPVSFVPSVYHETSEIVRWTPSDASYADVDGDGLQDLAIGRMPVRTPAELDSVIAKTLQYDARWYLTTATFAADYFDAGANESFTTASDRLLDAVPDNWTVDRIYLEQTPLATARAQLFADIAAGSGLTSYVGHSGLTSWGSSLVPVSSHLFKIGDVASLTNSGLPTVVTQLGCWNTYYASPKTESLGSRLLLADDKGAAAVLGANTLTQDVNGNRFGGALTPRLLAPGATLGDAIVAAKRDLVDRSSPQADLRDVLLGWILLGDPALKVVP
jgi:hypothetical protein